MSRNIASFVVPGLLAIALLFSLVMTSSLTREAERLKADLADMKDSLATLHRVVDTLKAQNPGLGEYMSTVQLHIAKLWFAGQASNWALARYEHDELEETIVAAEALHAMKDSVDISAVLQSVRQTELPLIGEAIAKKSRPAFEGAYRQTLSACNGCHRPAGYGFIHIITPTREPVTNQQWHTPNQSPTRHHE